MAVEHDHGPAAGGSAPAGTSGSGRQPFRFGVLQFFSWPNREIPLAAVYAQALDRIDRMESSGAYDAVWLAEHHFNTYSVCPSVHLMGMHVAARTRHLRIGTAVTLAGMYHPLRLAEEVALLDVLSEGRVNWGAGRGNDSTEFSVFGLDRESSYAKFHEHVDVVLQSWLNERITYHGQFVNIDNVEVLPKPLQQPHPPVWMASTSPEAIAWSSRAGHSILMDPHSTHVDIGRKLAAYREGLARAGHDDGGRITPIARLLAVAPTDAEAEEVARRGASWTVNSQFKQSRARAGVAAGPGVAGQPGDPIERYVNEVIIHGSPGRVADEIVRLHEEIGLDYLLCAPLSFQSFVLMTQQVIPAVARALPAVGAGVPYSMTHSMHHSVPHSVQ